jgi:hypothetical protein
VVTATVEAIEKSSRTVTVKKEDGNHDVLYMPAAIKRFDTLKDRRQDHREVLRDRRAPAEGTGGARHRQEQRRRRAY